MNSLVHVKEKAIKLRMRNKSLDDISNMLKVPRTTVYYWVKNIPITRTKKQSESQKKATQALVMKYSSLREKAYKEGLMLYDTLKSDPTFKDFITVYLTEGYRKSKHTVSVSNSNGKIILLSLYWFKKLSDKTIIFNVQTHVDQKDNDVKLYWSKLLGVRKEQINTLRKSNSGKLQGRNWRSEYGVISISIYDTYLRQRVQAFMDTLEKEWMVKISS